MAFLILIDHPEGARVVELSKSCTRLGSKSDNDLVIPLPGVSRHHARVEQTACGHTLVDDGSTNFVFVGERQVQRFALTHGTMFRLGDHVRVLYLEHPDETAIRDLARPGSDPAGGPVPELETLMEVVASINSSLDLDTVLATLIEKALWLMGAERGFVMLAEGDTLVPRIARNMQSELLDEQRQSFSRSFAREVIESGETSVSRDLDDLVASGAQSIVAHQIKSIMCAPLRIKDDVIGCLYVDIQRSTRGFSAAHIAFFSALANHAAIAIHNARMTEALKLAYEQRVIQERLNQELENARKVQELMLPKELPRIPGLSLAAKIAMANRVGGDYYDYIHLDEDRLAIVLADVAGHDIASALVLATCRNLLRTLLSLEGGTQPPGRLLATINVRLHRETGAEWFVALFLGLLDVRRRSLVCSNAGNPAPLLLSAARREIRSLDGGGIPLGMLEAASYTEDALEFGPGDLLLVHTDGLTEARSPDQRYFDADRVRELMIAHHARPLDELVGAIHDEVATFTGQSGLTDDVTLIALRGEL